MLKFIRAGPISLVWALRFPPKFSTAAVWLTPLLAQAVVVRESDVLVKIAVFFTKAGAFVFGSGLAIVPFFMRGIRPRFCPAVPGISDFLELNVRTYVRDAQGRHGVWFYSLDCDQPLAVWTARTVFHLPYQHDRMSATIEERGSVLECAGPPALSEVHRPAESSRGLEHSKTLPRTKQTQIDYACHRRGEPRGITLSLSTG